MEKPVVAQKNPIPVDVKAGETYYWCSCGKSAKQPFCDGSHQGTAFSPVAFTAKEDKTAFFCGCKHSKNAPFCDGAHNDL
ncbi:MAG: CDGSH iron-sulfur domain-containing protein [Sporomusaceae bacterium]|nr:CDGSH iron-sulfur domain-containing protein [Sporomusaceae bacterium]